jgi:hypothetical protein
MNLLGFIVFQVGGIYGITSSLDDRQNFSKFVTFLAQRLPVEMALKRKRPVHRQEDSNKRHKVRFCLPEANRSLSLSLTGSTN